ncbi:histidine kinase N-terminal 7TM domain-containing protein [Methanoregula sp.]|uniref:histidine kinase N-terminal 7TM domain-containing protein n=1 Tax=Methanoregula sp. TaxID=2052170 RepID=UPI0035699933
MIIQYSPAVIFLFFTGILSAFLAYAGWRNRAIPISRAFTLLMVAETVWVFGYALELMSPDLQTLLLINDIEYPGLQIVPIAWLFIVLLYTGRDHILNKKTVPLFFIVPAIVWLLVLTNSWHHLYYTGFYPQYVNGSIIWIYEHAPLFWIHIGYCYLLTLVALLLAVGRLFVPTRLYRRQMVLLVFAACIPAFFNIAYVFRIVPFPEFDLTPFAFFVSSIILAVGLLRYQLFSAVPVAYSQVFHTMKDGVIVTNQLHQVIDLNSSAERITGVSSQNAIGRSLAEVVPGLAHVPGDPTLENRELHVEVQTRHDGSPRFYDVLVTSMDTDGTGSAGYICLFRDISERKQAELALAQANRKIALLTSITRHDLQNKLMAVASYHELSTELSTDPVQKEYLACEEKAMNAMREQISFTGEYDKLGSEVPVWQNAGEVVARAKNHVDLHKISLTRTTGSLEIYADPMLEKVFYNLFDNAVKYGGDGITAITVSTRMAGNDVVIVVEDDGNGISAEDKARLFERGFGKNTGLGLFLSREILAITEITIRETGDPGRGAQFEIHVPCGKFRYAGSGQ